MVKMQNITRRIGANGKMHICVWPGCMSPRIYLYQTLWTGPMSLSRCCRVVRRCCVSPLSIPRNQAPSADHLPVVPRSAVASCSVGTKRRCAGWAGPPPACAWSHRMGGHLATSLSAHSPACSSLPSYSILTQATLVHSSEHLWVL